MRRFLALLIAVFCTIIPSFADNMTNGNRTANVEMSFTIPKYIEINSVLSPILIANITDRTGNLHAPLRTKFKVISNTNEPQKLYLKAKTTTLAGEENAMFMQGGRVYVAFGNVNKIPKSQALANCKIGSLPKDSPGIVAYPVLSVTGPKHKFDYDKYELEVKNGTSFVTLDIAPYVLKNSFAANDPKGFYRTTISLTEADF